MRKRARRVKDRAREMLNDDDRISRLPNDVIHHIFSFIDTRFVVQSSLLSSRWINTWKSHPRLNFEIDRSSNHTSGSRFPNFVHRFLSARDDNAEISTIDFRSNSIRLPLLKEIIIYAMSHKTRKINIEFLRGGHTRRGGIDISLFRSQFLQHLYLGIDFGVFITPTLNWDLPALTTLNLDGVTFTLDLPNDGARKSVELFSRFSNLKTLVLIDCRFANIDQFVIMSNGLESLSMLDLHHTDSFVISAPKLSSFTYNGMARFSLLAKGLHSLEKVNFHTFYHKSLQKQPELVELMINTFHQLFKAKFLSLNSDALKFLSEFPELLEREPCPFMNLQSLTLVEHQLPLPSIVYVDVLTYFQNSSPALKVNFELDRAPHCVRCVDGH
ncbi:putative F-box/FBD/LRR-repeat protein At4g13965 [Cynara cardunculus var. scolymus]|uniref:putative F-box/FBD/LRR-repeat protein At4g13965 n=1 Tax=Cynara cardunculus var. scolymus TaxID=59895 RepID=UPI000D626370|nr:putative F-box/FBD/LRR-repeat protein At4g13965 [Cynara cardunculus var. scolymus]